MDKSFEPKNIDQRWYKFWEENNFFAPSGKGEPYCILIPPPNVTGTLHMGHAFQHALMDALIRYHRMRGDNTLWQPGTDHAGIATQMVVERLLQAEGSDRYQLGRDEFIAKVWEWKKYSGDTITRQMRRLGDSTDWSDEWFTMDDTRSRAVTEVFVRLHEQGLIRKRKRLVNWDPKLHTAISDLEVISEEESGNLWHLRYPVEGSDQSVTVATTRPETMLGDTAVAVHPDDERYRKLVGKHVILPLAGRRIPIIADEYVDPEFGSGCVKITPAHDFNDYEIGQRHGLPMINIFDTSAKVIENLENCLIQSHGINPTLNAVWDSWEERELIPEKYRGMDRFDARKHVVADLESHGHLVKVDQHKLVVPRGDRSGVVVEPYLTDQWYLSMGTLAKTAIEAVASGKIRFVPDNWKNTYFHWMNNIQDWCISRQLWWGHRIPAWYDEAGNCYVGRDEPEARERHGIAENVALEQDPDVLDTWFSAALLPFTTLDWDGETVRRGQWLPTNVLVTAFDIIFFWVARMIMMTMHFIRDDNDNPVVPFEEIYITGLIRDEHGQKMSKSKGNILDPIDLIDGITLDDLLEKRTSGLMQPHLKPKIESNTRKEFPQGIKPHGTDALRFTLTALASPSRDINFDMGRLEGYRNFCNKLWNASRYVLMNTENEDCGREDAAMTFSAADTWIRYQLFHTVHEIEEQLGKYRFDLVAKSIYEFTWDNFCDWYLELSKPVLQSKDATVEQKRGTRNTLVTVLETLLRVAHPVMPFITEEIWQRVAPLAGKQGESIMLQPWPDDDELRALHGDPQEGNQAEGEINWLKKFILGIRRIRGDLNISPAKPLAVLLEAAGSEDNRLVEKHQQLLRFLARLNAIDHVESASTVPPSATALHGSMKIHVPMAGLIDAEAELERLAKQLAKTRGELESVQKKLANRNFVSNAPENVVYKEQGREQELREKLSQLQQLCDRVAQL